MRLCFISLDSIEDIDKNSRIKMDSNLRIPYSCSMCDHKTNSIFYLKKHLIKVHVKEETASPILSTTAKEEEHFDIFQSEVVQRRKESDIKVKEEPVGAFDRKTFFGHLQG